MSLLIPFLYIAGLTGSVGLLFRRRFEEALPVALLTGTLMVYLSGLFGSLLPGFYVSVACAAAFPALLIVLRFRARERFAEGVRAFLTPGFAIFAAIYLILFVMNFRKGLVWWDEYSHWAPAVKLLCQTNAFYCYTPSPAFGHLQYPPAFQIVEYLWCRLSGGFAEPFLYRALGTFSLALFFPALRNLRWERRSVSAWAGAAALIAVLFLSVEPLSGWFFSRVYIDGPLGVLFAYCLAAPLLDREPSAFRTVKLCAALSFLLLAKVSAVFFFAVTLVLLFALWLPQRRDALTDRRTQFGALIRAAALVCVPLAFYASWNAVIASCGLSATGSSALARLRLGLQPYQKESIEAFLRALVTTPLLTRPIPLNFVQLTAVFAALYIALGLYCRRILPARGMHVLTIASVAGAFAFAASLLGAYLLSFGESEATTLASYERYMNTYFTGLLTLGVMLFLYANGVKRAEHGGRAAYALSALALGLCLCMPDGLMMDYMPQLTDRGVSQRYENHANEVGDLTREDARVLFIAQGDVNAMMDGYVLSYLSLPHTVDFISAAIEPTAEEGWVTRLTPNELAAYIAPFDAVYLYHVDEAFARDYGALFPDSPADGALYAVEQGGAGLALTRIN